MTERFAKIAPARLLAPLLAASLLLCGCSGGGNVGNEARSYAFSYADAESVKF